MAVPIVGHKKKREAQLVIIKCNFYKQTLPIIADCVLLAVLTTSFLFFSSEGVPKQQNLRPASR